MSLSGRAVLVSAALLLAPRLARADETRDKCIAAHEESQLRQQRGALMSARETLRACAAEACPRILRGDCVDMLSALDRNLPTVVIEARDDAGDITDVRVSIDGTLVATRIDGKAIELDPGRHAVVVEAVGRAPIQQTVVVSEGQKNRVISAVWTPVRAPVSAPGRVVRPTPLGVYVLAGAAVTGLVGFAAFGLAGDAKKRTLDDCAPFCARSETDVVRTRYLLANSSLAFGAASLVGAAIWFVMRPEHLEPSDAAPAMARRWVRPDVTPTLGGAMLGVSGAY